MPLLYGEGRKSFTRLQEEIIRRSDDHSIFSWIDRTASRSDFRSLLARSPADFRHCQNIKSVPALAGAPFAITNRGLNISIPLHSLDDDGLEYLAALHYRFKHSGKGLAVRLRRVAAGSNQFARVDPYRLYEAADVHTSAELYVPEQIPLSLTPCSRAAGCKVNIVGTNFSVRAVYVQDAYCEGCEILRFDSRRVGLAVTARIMFVTTKKRTGYDWPPRLVVLAYNPHLKPSTIPAGVLGLDACIIAPNSCIAHIGTVAGDYDVRKPPAAHEIEWFETNLVSHYVTFGREIVSDEVFFTANVNEGFGYAIETMHSPQKSLSY
ncbi:hypothetical protein EK21DRAFT_109272 [Setomelanomma holmii]|uniref:DUF8212 domain-containing protein n=1 Tax=Setomelanomma holmii TaxID=210430 RepID=A0A9P4HEN4_9PLEO|nr:hypothetical protein EK21DRAFT_109272 [Setomelanomma holmii]